MKNLIDHVAASATGGDSKKPFDEVVSAYSSMGYKKFELYILGRGSSAKIENGPQYYLEKARQYGIKYSSLHLPPINDDAPESLEFAVKCALFAEALEIPVVVFNSAEKKYYAKVLKRFLKATEGHNINPGLFMKFINTLLPFITVSLYTNISIKDEPKFLIFLGSNGHW